MPELPEVENVRLSLDALGVAGQTFAKIELKRADLRVGFPKELRKLVGQTVRSISRKAKYLLFETDEYVLISHLGMTGSWRALDEERKHDHVILAFKSGLKLVFNDPRRFGLLDLSPKSKLNGNRWLKNLGLEPLAPEFTGDTLFNISRGVKASLKAFLMDQRRVVGVGNIYASEALFKARIKPNRQAGRVKRAEYGALVAGVQEVLRAAIAAGGSTISDYRNAHGEDGSFQNHFSVYDRAGKPCVICQTPIRSRVIVGRTTYWCPQCQR